jgi:Predicted metal-binding, possibly nucleic acid-binding protein
LTFELIINIINNAEVIFMRLTLAQLRKLQMPYSCCEELDLTEELNGFEDIVTVEKIVVNYEIRERGLDTYLVNFSFKADLIMQCAITLQDVPYTILADAEEIFTTDDSIEEAFWIEGQSLDTKEAVLTNVLIHKPMRVIAQGVQFESDEDPEQEDSSVHPAFAKLKDLL